MQAFRKLAIRPMSSAANRAAPAPSSAIDWTNIPFGQNFRESTKMIFARTSTSSWDGIPLTTEPYGPLLLEPSATILNYGQGIFEGIKAYRTQSGRIVVFRPEKNAERFMNSAVGMGMPPPSIELFLSAVQKCVQENAEMVPPVGGGAFYIRPILYGSGAKLGLGVSPAYDFLLYGSAVGNYLTAENGARLRIMREHNRAAPNGTGQFKCGGNYAPCFRWQEKARADGYNEILYMDTVNSDVIEETASSNFFAVTDKHVVTSNSPSILPGVTRDATIKLIQKYPEEFGNRTILFKPVDQAILAESTEVFLTGTATTVFPVGHISEDLPDTKWNYDFKAWGPVASKVYQMVTEIQDERRADPNGWVRDVFSDDFTRPTSNDEPLIPASRSVMLDEATAKGIKVGMAGA